MSIIKPTLTIISILAIIPAFALLAELNLQPNPSIDNSSVLGLQDQIIPTGDPRALAIYNGERVIVLREFSFTSEANQFSHTFTINKPQDNLSLVYISTENEDIDILLEVPESLVSKDTQLQLSSKESSFENQIFTTKYKLNFNSTEISQEFDVKITIVRQK